jgi:hypothetical protein
MSPLIWLTVIPALPDGELTLALELGPDEALVSSVCEAVTTAVEVDASTDVDVVLSELDVGSPVEVLSVSVLVAVVAESVSDAVELASVLVDVLEADCVLELDVEADSVVFCT